MKTKIAFENEYKGFHIQGGYEALDDNNNNIIVTRDGKPFRAFEYPSYKIWNMAAHFTDMVDNLLHDEERGKITPSL